MPCAWHTDVSVENCVFCEVDGYVMGVHGPADPLDAGVASTLSLMHIVDTVGATGKATILACMSWRLERGDTLHRLPKGHVVRTCSCGRKTLMLKTCCHCNLAKTARKKAPDNV